MRSLVNYWPGLGRRVVTFLDDGIGGSPDYASCLVLSLRRSDLDSASFFVNLQKSVWEPPQVGTWLGFHLDFSLDFITGRSSSEDYEVTGEYFAYSCSAFC